MGHDRSACNAGPRSRKTGKFGDAEGSAGASADKSDKVAPGAPDISIKAGIRQLKMKLIPIHELLHRIRWDPKFARGDFALGYYDRVLDRVLLVPFKEVSFPDHTPNAFRLVDADGRIHRVPFHRVREVHRDGQRIWHRPPRAK